MNMYVGGLSPVFNEMLLRRSIETEVERLITLLDALDGDTDLEPDADDEPSLGAIENHPTSWETLFAGVLVQWGPVDARRVYEKSQEHWSCGGSLHDECEVENEHGGNVLDEPHDSGDDDEPWLGWAEERLDQSKPYVHAGEPCSERELDLAEGLLHV